MENFKNFETLFPRCSLLMKKVEKISNQSLKIIFPARNDLSSQSRKINEPIIRSKDTFIVYS